MPGKSVDAALRALAEPRRREVVRILGQGELSAGEIASYFEVTRQAVSQHLKVLKEAGLVDERRHQAQRWYKLRPEGADEVKKFLELFWPGALERLQTSVEVRQRAAGAGNRK